MRNARDTWLHFLSDNLSGLTVVNIRRDANNPQSNELTDNAICVEFTYDRPGIPDSLLQASVDVIYDDELTAIDAAASIWKLLSASEITPLMSYANPSSPVPLGTMLRWNTKQIKFNKLVSDLSFRYNAHIVLQYHDPTMTVTGD